MNEREDVVSKLVKYYENDASRVAGSNFDCEHQCRCRSTMTDKKTGYKIPLYEGRAAFVGSEYGDGHPRILVIAMDAGNTEHECKKSVTKEMEARRKEIETKKPEKHMRGTATCLRTLLRRFLGSENIEDYLSRFAMINAAKCSRKCCSDPVYAKLYERCIPYMYQEIDCLSPDLIWIQGIKNYQMLERVQKMRKEIRFRANESCNIASQTLCAERISFVKYNERTHGFVTKHPSPRNRIDFSTPPYCEAAHSIMALIGFGA